MRKEKISFLVVHCIFKGQKLYRAHDETKVLKMLVGDIET